MVTAFCSALPLHVWVSPYSPFLEHSLCYWWLLMEKLLKPCFGNLLVVVLTWLSNLLTALFFSVWLVLV